MQLTDKNKKLIAGGIALVAIVLIAFFVLRGRGGGTESGAAAGGFAQAGAGQGASPALGGAAAGTTAGAGRGGMGPGSAGGAAVPGGGGAAAPAGPAAPGTYPSVGLIKMGIGPAEPTRQDPFVTFNPPPQPIPPEVLVQLPPVGLVAGGLRPGGGVEAVAKIGNRRVAGLLFNDQAWAVLEDEEGNTYVVKPGDVVEGMRITAISRDAIFLKDRDGKKWEVPLRGLGPGGQAGSPGTTAAAMPEMPPA